MPTTERPCGGGQRRRRRPDATWWSSVRGMRTPVAASVLFAAVANVLTVVSVATDHWESVEYGAVRRHGALSAAHSYLDDRSGFYKVAVVGGGGNGSNASAIQTHYVRARHGGIWRVCDRIPDSFRLSRIYLESKVKSKFDHRCYNYIRDYDKAKLTDKGIALVRMQNSAISCVIVALLCLIAAACTGFFGIWKKQVSACMVTGVMYSVSAVFLCFTLTIMMTKIRLMYRGCYTLDSDVTGEICHLMEVRMSWSMSVGWAAFIFTVLTVTSWLYLSRYSRLELSKSVI